MKLATEYELVIACLTNDNHVFIVESILDKLTSELDGGAGAQALVDKKDPKADDEDSKQVMQ